MEATNGNTVWTEETIEALLKSNDRAVEKAIVAIYKRQTEDEKATQATKHSNNVGFSGADASRGTYYAEWILGKNGYPGKRLTGKHLAKAREMALKYRKQLLSIAKDRAKPATPAPTAETPAPEMHETRRECVSDCDICLQTKHGTEYFHNGTPVLFACHGCDSKPNAKVAQRWTLTRR